ncbi:hypothetical protein C0993_007957 [Termitomyces sp. T159_Od127]|nr:hypothetical protein C0993_007957 [Termitomyces sp. T159_Od127]
MQQVAHVLRINSPEVYDSKSKQLTDQFAEQVKAAAEFETFQDERQKIVWVQSYLTGSAQQWSAVITTGSDDLEINPRRFRWVAWLTDFKAAFCMRDQVQDALTHIGQLTQGSKSITNYCMAFFELKGKLGQADANGEYVKDQFWKGLSAVSMEALVNTDYQTVEEAWDILLHCESKLADIATHRKGHWHGGTSSIATASGSMATTMAAWSAPPPPPTDPNAMDMQRVCRPRSVTSVGRDEHEQETAGWEICGGDPCKVAKVRSCGVGVAIDTACAGGGGGASGGHKGHGGLRGKLLLPEPAIHGRAVAPNGPKEVPNAFAHHQQLGGEVRPFDRRGALAGGYRRA